MSASKLVGTRFAVIATILFLALTGLVCNSHAFLVNSAKYGAIDPISANRLKHINLLASLRHQGRFNEILSYLTHDEVLYANDKNSIIKIRNEISDILSYNLLDIEEAVRYDRMLLSTPVSTELSGDFVPANSVANSVILADEYYFNEYISIAIDDIIAKSRERLEVNINLLQGAVIYPSKNYDINSLLNLRRVVQTDVDSTYIGTHDRLKMLSRLIRVDYEMMRLNSSDLSAHKWILDRSISVNQIDLTEINFLSLTEYFRLVYQNTGNIHFAELALETVYRPYQNLRDPVARWKYNKLINGYISTLIDANFKAGRFDEVLYYANLNKSRMLLEERLAFAGGASGSAKVSDLVADDGIPRTASGLPDKAWFKAKLAATPQFLDFYVGGSYVTEAAAGASRATRAERSVMPFTSRNSARSRTSSEPTEVFKDDALYITHVINGRATAVKLEGGELATLRSELEKSYAAISETQKANASPALQALKARLQLPAQLTVSPDKWLSAHPLDYHLQAQSVRAVNFFTSVATGKLNRLSVAGFFNPTLDLAGADDEADVIQALLPQANLMRREAARKGALASASAANIIHLSMHGNFNAADPTQSKLVFAGATNDDSTGDPNALYATEMTTVPSLRNRDLVFAAACQTGLLAADRTNTSELTGILRPLTANRNKNLILSLWNVSDQATGEFVKAFYQRLAATQDVKDAFHHAQDQLRTKYPHPYYWAAFYLSQAS